MHAQEQQSRPYPLITFNNAHFTGLGIFSRLDRVLISLNGASVCVSLSPPHTHSHTGVRSSGVEMGELSLFSLIPLPKSKSQIFTGEIWKWKNQSLDSWGILSWLHELCHAYDYSRSLDRKSVLLFSFKIRGEKKNDKTNSPCLHVHIRCFQAWGLCGPFLEDTHKGHALDIKLVLQGLRTTKRITKKTQYVSNMPRCQDLL